MFDYEKHLSVSLNCAVFDLENGTILKLDSNKKIVRAVSGFDVLDGREVEEMYGKDAIFNKICWPERDRKLEEKGYWVLSGLFEASLCPVICQVISFIKAGKIKNKTL